ncbi:MAG: hypothetical protein AABY22_13230 [Nanoarchaeota archaeon]
MFENQLKQEIEQNFGQSLTAKQLWTLTKLSKHVRLRARNNSAFNNLFSRLFPYAKFNQVNKLKKDGTSYLGLQIKIGEEIVEQNNTEEGE